MSFFLKFFVVITAVFVFTISQTNSSTPSHENATSFAIVELFTSEGCSSCPPAEKIVNTLAMEAEKNKTNVFFLNYHVSYWDYIGWKDVYGDKQYAARQDYYSDYLAGGKSYTPQMIVNGSTEFVGSNETKARKSIEDALLAKKENLFQSLRISKKDSTSITLDYSLSKLSKNCLIQIALVEKNLPPSKVTKGENKGRTLEHYSVVRRLETIDNANFSGVRKILYPTKLNFKNFMVIAFVQNKETRQILSAEQIQLK